MVTEIIARNMWIAPKRNSCEYFEDIQDLIEEWSKCAERQKMILDAEIFLNLLNIEYPLVYDYIRNHYCES